MKKQSILLFALILTACSEPAPTDTVESLIADPERLQKLRKQCQTERAKLGAELCDAVAEATRRRFMGDGKVPYTPPEEKPVF